MIVLRYSRLGTRKYLSHIDVLRDFGRIVRRADIPVAYSEGFNPHALLFFSPPTPVGVSSEAEYVGIGTAASSEETLARFNAAVTEEMRASEAFLTAKISRAGSSPRITFFPSPRTRSVPMRDSLSTT